MFSIIIRSLLVLTSFSPVVFVYGISQWEINKSIKCFIPYLCASICMTAICLLIMIFGKRKSLRTSIPINNIKLEDKDILVYVFIFLMPFIRGDNSLFGSQLWTTLTCILILVIVITDIDAYYFNPIIRMFGYHIYSVVIDGLDTILIAKTEGILRPDDKTINVAKVTRKIYIYTENMDAE